MDARRRELVSLFDGNPFTRQQALDAGLLPHDLRSDAVRSLFRGTYLDARVEPTHARRCAAAALLLPAGGRVAGCSAARLRNLPVPADDIVSVSIPAGHRLRVSGLDIRHHRVEAPSDSVSRLWVPDLRQHLPVSPGADLLAEVCDRLSLVDAVVLADALLAQATSQGRGDLLRAWASHRHSTVRRIRALADAGAESPMETRLRLLLVLAGFPAPCTQWEVCLSGRMRRLDLAYPDVKVAVEYDGGHHFASAEQRQRDVERFDDMAAEGWRIVRVVALGIFREPQRTIDRVAAALEDRGLRIGLDPLWRVYFPSGRV